MMPVETRPTDQTIVGPPQAVPSPAPQAAETEQALDWEICLATPPPRPAGTLLVHLVAAGRSRPIPVPEPGAD
jgi:hypothetical protein